MMGRWVAAHFGAGVIGALAAYPAFFGLFKVIAASNGEWLYVFLIPYLAGLLVILAVPILIYQAIALRHAVVPRRWIGFTLIALLPAPALLVLGNYGLLSVIAGPFPFGAEEASSRWIFTGLSGWVLTGFAVGLIWAAPMQWFAVRGAVWFRRWWLYAGPSLGLAAVTVVTSFLCALIREPYWLALLPLGALIYAVGIYPIIRPLLGTSPAAA
jgi:hypothetical protein